MEVLLLYILKSSLLLAMFVSLFMVFMSHETFHRLNRFLLLGVVASALVLPFVNIGVESPFSRVAEKIHFWNNMEMEAGGTAAIDMDNLFMGKVAIDDMSATPAEGSEPFNWLLLVSAVYFSGVTVLLVRQLVVYVRLTSMINSAKAVNASLYVLNNDIKLRVHNGKEKPFSWFGWVVISGEDLNDGGCEILRHETAHVNAGHSWDIVFADVVIMLQWFNPMAWIMKNCLKDIHEFEADEAVINSGVNAKQYQLLIIKKAVGSRLYSIANSFNHSLTKKRITMMCKEKSNKWSRAKALYILPVVAIAALSFSTVENVNASEAETVSKVNEIVSNEASEFAEKSVNHESSDVKQLLPVADEDEKVYQVVEKTPEFPGGVEAMIKYLSENIKYPEDAKAAGKEGRAFISFVVKKDGSINDVTLLRGTGVESLDNEAMRVISSMPNWNPGMQGGKAVNVKYTIPIVFKKGDTPENIEMGNRNKEQKRPLYFDGNPDDILLILDGKVYKGVINDIASESIESITIMKDIEKLPEEFKKACQESNKSGALFIETKKKETVKDNVNDNRASVESEIIHLR